MNNVKLKEVRKVTMRDEEAGCVLGCFFIFIYGLYILAPVITIGLILLLIKFLFF